jgi:hypothetical protein
MDSVMGFRSEVLDYYVDRSRKGRDHRTSRRIMRDDLCKAVDWGLDDLDVGYLEFDDDY